MADTRRIKLGNLLDIAFEIPESGVVNIRLLFEILRALITKLGLHGLDVAVDLGPTSSSSRALSGRSLREGDTGYGNGAGGIFSASLEALDPEARAAEIARRRAEEVSQVLNLLRAYLVRLQALEVGLDDMRAKRAEDLETMGKMLVQIDHLDARLCAQEKKVAKLEADMECLGLAMLDYDIKLEDIYRQLDLVGIEIREVKCQIRCIEKDRQQFVAAVQTVTEQINHFSVTKADKDVMERQLALRALAADLRKYVPFECFNLVQSDFGRNLAQIHEQIYRQEQQLKTKAYELENGLKTKAELLDMEELRKQQAKILVKWKQTEMQYNSKTRSSVTAAGVILKSKGSANCLTCGLDASLEGSCQLIPRPIQFIPPSKTKEIFTLQSRYCGGDFTVTKPVEKVVIPGPVLGLDCSGKSTNGFIQVIGEDGCLYVGDSECLDKVKIED